VGRGVPDSQQEARGVDNKVFRKNLLRVRLVVLHLSASDQCASDLFRCRDSSPWPLLFLLSVEPGENIEHGLPGGVPQWIDQGNNGRLGRFHGMADFLLLSATNGIGAEVAELKDVAFL